MSSARHAHLSLLILTCCLMMPAHAYGQGRKSSDVVKGLTAGQRLRIKSPALVGEYMLVGASADALTIASADGGSTLDVPLSSIVRLDARARRSRGAGALRGAGIGFLVGAGSGAIIGAASGDEESSLIDLTATEKAAILGIVLGAGGAVLGAVIGTAAPGERWQRVLGTNGLSVGSDASGRLTLGVTHTL